MKKVVLFVRVSTENQELESQLNALKQNAYIDGYTDDDIIVIAKKESGVKLKEAEREGLNELKRVIEKEDIDGVYLFELSRLSRDPVTLYSLRDNIFKSNKIQLKCLKPSFTLLEEPDRQKFDTMGSLVFSIFGCFAEQEIIEKKERFHRGREQKAVEGKFAGGRVPYGYTIDKSRGSLIVIDEEEASVVRTIYDMYEAGYSQPKIALELYDRGVKYRTFMGNLRLDSEKNFTLHFIGHILKQELYTGRKVKSPCASFVRTYPPIISEAQYENCREIAGNNVRVFGKQGNIYFAKSLIVCPECGSKLQANIGSVKYQCVYAKSVGYRKKMEKVSISHFCNNQVTISINGLDSLLWHIAVIKECEYLLSSAKNDKQMFQDKVDVLKSKMDAILPNLSSIENKRSRIVEAFIDGEISKEIKVKKIVELDTEKLSILKKKIEYEKDMEYFQSRIDDIESLYSIDISTPEGIADNISNLMSIRDKIESTNNDEEKSRLIHKHVKNITIVEKEIDFKFATRWVGKKKTKSKFVTIRFYDGTIQYYHFVCNGGCAQWINSNENADILDYLDIDIQQRFERKMAVLMNQRYNEKLEGQYSKQRFKKGQKIRGFEAMAKFLCFSSSKSIRLRYASGFFRDSITVDEDNVHVMDVDKALKIMRQSESEWIKKVLKKFDATHEISNRKNEK